MRKVAKTLAVAGVLGTGVAAWGQTHVVKKPDAVVRALGVYEWTGEEAKPTASRLVPVTLFINGHLEDAGVYLARPVPLALDRGTVFEVEHAGVDDGTLEVAYQRHRVTAANGSYDDGWLAVGAFKPKPVEKVTPLKAGTVAKVDVSGGSGPHFGSKPDATGDSPAAKPVDRSGAAGGGTTVSADGPTLHRGASSGSTPGSTNGADTSDADDPAERPTLRRRTPEQTKAENKKKDQASVEGVGSLNDDPDRPNLHRGAPTSRLDEDSLPPLVGVPAGMEQRVAVSDAKDRPEHDFKREFESDAERAEVMGRMETVARAQLAAYGVGPAAAAAPTPTPKPASTPAARAAARKKAVGAPVPVALADEVLRGFTLSYGGAATYEFSASSPGAGGVTRYVTVVAQREPLGDLKVALASVTDAAHLDRTPWFRLVDAVDVEASNRASLLFELRGQTTREFALYRVIGAKADQVFVTSPAE